MIDIDINQLRHLYYNEKKSASEVAKILGCAPSVIYDHMKKNGLQRRSYSEAHKLWCAQKVLKINLAEIVRLYFDEHLSLAKVGARLGVSQDTVRNRLLTAGYETRKRGESRHPRKPRDSIFTDDDLAEMERLYCEAERSSAEIAWQFNCSDFTVRTHLKKRGVKLRTIKEAQALRRKKEAIRKPTIAETSPVPTLPPKQVTPERILQLRNDENLTIDAIAGKCSLSNLEVFNILQENGGI